MREKLVFLNPFKTSILFMGQRQTVQTQIRCCRMRHLIRVSTVCLQNFYQNLNKNKIQPNTPKFGNGLFLLITVCKSIRHKWINLSRIYHLHVLEVLVVFSSYLSALCRLVSPSYVCVDVSQPLTGSTTCHVPLPSYHALAAESVVS